jgi:hypothetical protein
MIIGLSHDSGGPLACHDDRRRAAAAPGARRPTGRPGAGQIISVFRSFPLDLTIISVFRLDLTRGSRESALLVKLHPAHFGHYKIWFGAHIFVVPENSSPMPAVSAKMVRRCIEKSDRENGCRQKQSQSHGPAHGPVRAQNHLFVQGRDVLGHRVDEESCHPAHPRICSQSLGTFPRSPNHSSVHGREELSHIVHDSTTDPAHSRTPSAVSSRKLCRQQHRRDLSVILEESSPNSGRKSSPLKLVFEFCNNWRLSVGAALSKPDGAMRVGGGRRSK